MNKSLFAAVVLAITTSGVVHGLEVVPVQLSSGNFTVGFGADVNSGTGYTTNETTGFNVTDPSPGVFAFTYAFSQRAGVTYTGAFSGDGPTFPGRVLTNGVVVGFDNVSGYSPNFQFTLGGSYITALPLEAVPGSGKLRLNIDSIRVWGVAHDCCDAGGDTLDLFWTETTLANPGNSSPVFLNLTGGTGQVTASNYKQLMWDPTEFQVAGLSSSRIFVLNTAILFNVTTPARAIDGFEILGSATLIYDVPVPEPSTGVLLGVGLVGLAIRRRRNRRMTAA